MTDYFDRIGQLHPFDLVNAPGWLPRIGRRSPRDALRFFDDAVADIVAARRDASEGDEAGEDLLSRLLAARDPQTGQGLSKDDVAANILTFIGAGHETTANALTCLCIC